MSTAPLSGIRVLDLTRVLAGPFCTMVLADLGAEVVKIERPGVGDDARQFGPFLPSGESGYFASVNRGKKSLVLDLKDPTDRATFLALVDRADVVVENFRPETMERMGLSSDVLRARNPRLIYASATGFGRSGPDADKPAYDVIIQARSGLMSLTGHAADEPARVGSSISDILAGLYTAIGVCAALREREGTGVGGDLDLAMLDCSVSVLENAVARYSLSGEPPRPLGTRHPSIAPFQAFHAADGDLVIAAGNDQLWRTLCGALGDESLADDPLLASNHDRCTHAAHLETRINALLAGRSVAECVATLEDAGVPAAPINDMSHVLGDRQLAAREMWHTLTDRDGRELLTAATPFCIDGRKPRLEGDWPRLGEHGAEILRSWLGDRMASPPAHGPKLGSVPEASQGSGSR
ncbi:MAG: CaiB/BaiF CoA transferase family protein [Planctomycetaceae bacterium]